MALFTLIHWSLVEDAAFTVALSKRYSDGSGNITTENALINY